LFLPSAAGDDKRGSLKIAAGSALLALSRTTALDELPMASQLVASRNAPPATAADRLIQLLVRRRVPISVALFAVLVLIDLLVLHSRPRDVLDWTDPLVVFGVVCVGGGLLVRTWAAGTLRKRRELAQTGPYAWIRHPLYFGSLVMMVGFGTLIHDPITLWVVAGPVAWIYWEAVKSEERQIAKLFPMEWTRYAALVPQLMPYRPVRPSFADWSLIQWMNNSEYQAWVGSGIALVAIKLWQLAA
jgi:protein-S-isoprenylcysteine O-methyltransferase Ste14